MAGEPKRIYLANDDHTDYLWTADAETYNAVFVDMLDYYLRLADETNDPSRAVSEPVQRGRQLLALAIRAAEKPRRVRTPHRADQRRPHQRADDRAGVLLRRPTARGRPARNVLCRPVGT